MRNLIDVMQTVHHFDICDVIYASLLVREQHVHQQTWPPITIPVYGWNFPASVVIKTDFSCQNHYISWYHMNDSNKIRCDTSILLNMRCLQSVFELEFAFDAAEVIWWCLYAWLQPIISEPLLIASVLSHCLDSRHLIRSSVSHANIQRVTLSLQGLLVLLHFNYSWNLIFFYPASLWSNQQALAGTSSSQQV